MVNHDHVLQIGRAHDAIVHDGVMRSMLENAAGEHWPAGIVVHFGGGVVGRLNTNESVECLRAVYQSAGAFPLFIDWNAHPIDIVTDHIAEISGEPLFRAIVKLLVKFLRAKVLAPGATRTVGLLPIDDGGVELELRRLRRHEEPFGLLPVELDADATLLPAEERQLVSAMASDPDVTRAVSELAASVAQEPSRSWTKTRHSPVYLAGSVAEGIRQNIHDREMAAGTVPLRLANGAVLALLRTIDRLASGRGHGLYPTVVEEVLREFYADTMLRRFWDHTKRDAAQSGGPLGQGNGGRRLLDEIEVLRRRGWAPRMTIVGHSAGCLLLSHWLESAVAILPDDQTFDMIWLAPACPTSRMAGMITRCGRRIRGFRQFALSDVLERRDAAIPHVYPRSLLYLVSGLLETESDTPLAGMERFAGNQSCWRQDESVSLATVDGFCGTRHRSQVWSMANGDPGCTSTALHHSTVDRDAATLAAMKHILEHGFEPAASH